jgi:hypothetical protein
MIDVAIRDELVHIRCLLERLLGAVVASTPSPAPSRIPHDPEAANLPRVPAGR